VVTDYIAHRCWVEPGVDAWTVPCVRAGTDLEEHGVARSRIALTGIPVRAAFERITSVREPQKEVRVLVTSGGFGVGPIARIVRSFAGVPHVALTIVCGAAEKTKARVEREVRACGLRARVIGFEKDMPARLAEADVVVGKAGGLTVSETMTAGRPMIIASAVPGNEKINEEFVVAAGAGVAAEPDAVGAAVERMRAERAFARMGERASALVPGGAAARVVDVAMQLLEGTSIRRAA
jgi:processive 1,2-diacylglycerol beta-glucosyltransferase